jgi:F-type H+-transporting ATPase subunit epsilon
MPLRVDFVSPEDLLYSGEATMVVARTRGGGEIAFMEGHEPFIGSLQTSEVRVNGVDGTTRRFAVRGGFVSVTGTSVTVLSDEAQPAETINADAVRAQRAEAEAALAADPDDDFAKDDVRWADVRLAILSPSSSGGH